MSATGYTLVKLHKDNIRSFDDYLPQRAALRILDEGVFGWGVVVDGYASGVILCEKNTETDELWILWLYVDEEVRGRGIADRLCEEAFDFAGDVNGIVCEYLYPAHAEMEEYLGHKGYHFFTKREENRREDEDEVHLARLSMKEELSDDAWIMENKPLAGYQMPRLLALREYIGEMGLPALIVVPPNGDPGICVERKAPLVPVDIYVLPDVEDPERYSVALRIALDVDEEDMGRAEELIEEWSQDVGLVTANLLPGDEMVEFVAAMPVESGLPEQGLFNDFFQAYLDETDSLLKKV